MTYHHTKNKGDLGVFAVKLEFCKLGYTVLSPDTEHAPFDMVAYKDNKFLRVQVKYRAAKDDAIQFSARTSWADRNGTHMRAYDKSQIDIVAIYCPDTDKCYFLDIDKMSMNFTLRLKPTKNNQKAGIHMADDYLSIPASSEA